MPLAISKDVQDELLAIRADLETAMFKFIQDRHYGAAERILVTVDRSLHNLIRDAAIVTPGCDEPAKSNPRGCTDNRAINLGLRISG